MPQPQLRERRKAPDGTLVEWDGNGWLAVNLNAPPPPPPKEDYARFGPMQSMLRDQAEGGDTSGLPMVGAAVGGALGNIPGAALGGAAGEAAAQLINRAKGRPAPTSATEAATKLVTQGAIGGGAQAVGVGAGKAMTATAPWLMQKVLKPAASLLDEYRTTGPRVVRTLLDEGVNVTQAGLEKLQALLKANNAEIKAMVDAAPGEITKKNVAARVLPVAVKTGNQTNPQEGLKVIGDTVDGFMNHPIYKGNLSPAEAQRMKIATYQKLGNSYGEMKGAAIETEKALARGLKEEVAEAVPGVAAKNARDAELMASGEAVAKRITADANADPLGLLYAASSPQLFIAGLIQKQPVIRSMIANGMWANAGRVAKVSPDAIRAAVLALTGATEPRPDQE